MPFFGLDHGSQIIILVEVAKKKSSKMNEQDVRIPKKTGQFHPRCFQRRYCASLYFRTVAKHRSRGLGQCVDLVRMAEKPPERPVPKIQLKHDWRPCRSFGANKLTPCASKGASLPLGPPGSGRKCHHSLGPQSNRRPPGSRA